MDVTVVLIHNECMYQYNIKTGEVITFGSHKKDTVAIPDFPAEGICIRWTRNGFAVLAKKLYNFEKVPVPLDTIIMLDKASKTVLYLNSLTAKSDRTIKLPYHCSIKFGRSDTNDVMLKLPFVSGTHFILKNEGGNVRVEDAGSTNGIYLNGKKTQIARVKSGDVLSILSVNIRLLNGVLSFENVGNKLLIGKNVENTRTQVSSHFPGQNARLLYRRSPRTQEKMPQEDIILSNAPSKAQRIERSRNMLSSLAGTGAMFASGLITSAASPALLAARAASLVSPITSVATAGSAGKKQRKNAEQYDLQRSEKYRAYIDDQKARIESVAGVQRSILAAENPEPKLCIETLFNLKRNLWERMPADRDFLDVRLGMGYENLCVKVKSRQENNAFQMEDDEIRELSDQIIEETRIVDHVPARVSLFKNNTVGVIGGRQKVVRLVTNMLIELTTLHCFEDVRLVGIFDRSEAYLWEPLKWLPHIWDETRQSRLLAFDKENAHELCESLNEMIKTRLADSKESSAQGEQIMRPQYIFLLGSKDLVEKEQIMHNLLLNNKNLGITALFLFNDMYSLPNECNYIIDLDNGPCAYNRSEANNKFFFTMDANIDTGRFDSFARRMSAIELDGLSQAGSLPESITFMQGYGVQSVEKLNVWERWSTAVPYRSLGAPIGVMAGEKPFVFDIHEKAHGPHGLVAGTTGSGKSELLQTWILSMALNFHPHDVAFVLIDYKGGGMANLLEPLPHVVGKITNIAANIGRSLISLQSEIKRRLAVFDEYGVNHIDKYQKLYKAGKASEPMPHLIIVADEFAELKKEEPAFISGLVSASRVGRSLGIHLVLATQKPGGVVDDQIQSNSRFRLCLKVQDVNDSREMIKRPDAARITRAGRSFIRVGEDEYFDLFQSFWSGAPYVENAAGSEQKSNQVRLVELNGRRLKTVAEKETAVKSDVDELSAVVRHIGQVAEEHGVKRLNGPWLPELPERLVLRELIAEGGFDGQSWHEDMTWLRIPIGMYDIPKAQAQGVQYLDFASEGHYGIYGAPGTGKTTFLKSLVLALGTFYTPRDVNIYILDCGGWSMSVFANMPHVGGVALDGEEEKFMKFEKLITQELEERKKRFLQNSVNSLTAYRESVADDIPAIVVAIDNIIPIFDLYPDLENFFIMLARDGSTYGIYLIYTANSTSGIKIRILQNIRSAVAFELTDKGDYTTIVGRLDGMALPKVLGRAFFKGNPPIEFQALLPAPGETDRQITLEIQNTVSQMNAAWKGVRPKPIPVIPDIVSFESMVSEYTVRTRLPVGIDCENIRTAFVDLESNYAVAVVGGNHTGKSQMLKTLCKMISLRFEETKIFAFDSSRASLLPAKSLFYKYAASGDEEGIKAMLDELVRYLNERKKGQNQARAIDGDAFDENAYIAPFEMLCIVIDDLKEFVDTVSDESKNTMERICRMAQKLGVIVLCAGRTLDIKRYNEIESLTRVIVGNQNGISVEGTPAQHTYFQNNLKYSERDIQPEEGSGYLFINGKCSKVKYLSKEGIG